MSLHHLAVGAASAERMRRRLARTGETLTGQKLWTESEIEKLKQLYPLMTYSKIARRLKGRTYGAIRAKAQELGLTKPRHVWTGAEVARLRKVYLHGTVDEVRAAFPQFKLAHIRAIARYHGLSRPRKPFKLTGIPALDQIRQRAFELGYSMSDIDALARSKSYFRQASWLSGFQHHRAIAKAIAALDGVVAADWHEES